MINFYIGIVNVQITKTTIHNTTQTFPSTNYSRSESEDGKRGFPKSITIQVPIVLKQLTL